MVKTVDMRTVYKVCRNIETTTALLIIPCLIGMIIIVILNITGIITDRSSTYYAIPLFASCIFVGIILGSAYVKKQLCDELKSNEEQKNG